MKLIIESRTHFHTLSVYQGIQSVGGAPSRCSLDYTGTLFAMLATFYSLLERRKIGICSVFLQGPTSLLFHSSKALFLFLCHSSTLVNLLLLLSSPSPPNRLSRVTEFFRKAQSPLFTTSFVASLHLANFPKSMRS